ncbi:signal peptide peptidase SppA [Candidatus Micrarchaeota archaeon]|nr:signal peptide peptidase SppA [Candidatus Micrarchaeota archaeon]
MAINAKQTQKNSWMKYAGILLLGFVFLVFLGVLIVFSAADGLFQDKCVAVMNIEGEITTESVPQTLFSGFVPGSEDIANTIRSTDAREDVGAILFVINSPGGSVVASDEIYDAVNSTEKPTVAYFREVAASGGYYVASSTDYIVSEPFALTGSIGAVMTLSDMSGLLEKIGMNITDIKSGAMKDIGSPFRPPTENETELLQIIVDDIFQDFKNAVISGRGSRLNMQKFEEVLDARVLTGKQAKEIGLVDALGNKQDAIRKAAELAGMDTENLRICEVDASPERSGGLFDAKSIITYIETRISPEKVRVSYG